MVYIILFEIARNQSLLHTNLKDTDEIIKTISLINISHITKLLLLSIYNFKELYKKGLDIQTNEI